MGFFFLRSSNIRHVDVVRLVKAGGSEHSGEDLTLIDVDLAWKDYMNDLTDAFINQSNRSRMAKTDWLYKTAIKGDPTVGSNLNFYKWF